MKSQIKQLFFKIPAAVVDVEVAPAVEDDELDVEGEVVEDEVKAKVVA